MRKINRWLMVCVCALFSLTGDVYKRQVLGNDLSVYPSYYEPWGYTPLESVAFHVPTITTDSVSYTHLDVYKRQV